MRSELKHLQKVGLVIDSVSVALSGSSDSALGTLSHAASPYVANRIGQYFKEHNKQGSAEHIAAHALLGALDAGESGNNPLSAALAAGGSEAVAGLYVKVAYGTEDVNTLTAEQRNGVAAIASSYLCSFNLIAARLGRQ